MNDQDKLKILSIALYVFGAIFVAGVYLMMMVWPARTFLRNALRRSFSSEMVTRSIWLI